ncbi:hypothetical protein [Actinomadura madurae]|uniref:hypothetical protein n=1 Tax=Actinomadura madurae TaxID=1993 RepID=UPI0027E22713|nr:hypothetical protein [Actinomadura madurae]
MKDPNNTRNTAPRRGSPLWTYFLVVILLGVAAGATAFSGLSRADLDALVSTPVFWILGGFIIFGELRPIITPGSTENNGATTSTTFSFAALLYAGLPVAAALQAVAVITCGILRARAPHRIAFNAAQYTLSLAAAQLVLALFGDLATPSDRWVPDGSDLPAIALAGRRLLRLQRHPRRRRRRPARPRAPPQGAPLGPRLPGPRPPGAARPGPPSWSSRWTGRRSSCR